MVCKDTLRIKHLPKELTDVQKEQFIRHFGAIKVKVITSKAKATSVIYAKFESEEIAKNLLFRLHQISILNCRLSVEYADHDILQGQLSAQKVDVREGPDKRFFKNFINHVNAFNDSVGFHQPPPSHLKYNYPKANRPTINNIAHALATVPRFYTQVLHLMNKMNLPPPFAMPEPPMHSIPISPFATQTQRTNQIGQKRKNPSSSESELESDGEGGNPSEIIPEKRMLTQKKPLKRAKFITQEVARGSAPSKPVEKVEEVFEKVEVQPQKKIELKVTQELVVETPTLKSPECTNYNPGEPTNKVYIKNCAKSVVSQDLEYIFRPVSFDLLISNLMTCSCRYREEGHHGKPSEFNIRLMQEGRMKGQAFVTLDSVEQAQKAVNETNGFILKDRPLVVSEMVFLFINTRYIYEGLQKRLSSGNYFLVSVLRLTIVFHDGLS
ncbi:hypothetical protein D910_06958 [Dendroctonus ponderosae]|uniref:RRM domain-containing protein n=1 Tax=Dendroctonus ponderosae TaxID=77166 RepID=U4UB89_DENPD|nr:hypothetical protein D910_06958 [Dendroctonus ponderosae]